MRYVSFILCFLYLSCSTDATQKEVYFFFDGSSYILPNVVEKIQKENPFSFSEYMGFTHESTHYRSVLQLAGMPMWDGDDNIPESEYKESKVIGITFLRPVSEVDLNALTQNLEKNYTVKFRHLQGCNFQFMEPRPGFFIVLSQKNGDIQISFYRGISEKKLCEYASSVW